MPRRHPALPACWLMTDERQGEALWAALSRLPKGGGVVFRHYRLPPPERRAVFDRVRRIARARRLVLVLAGPPRLARAWRADGAHGRSPYAPDGRLLRTAPAHDRREVIAAAGADLVFLSPVFATRSHPGAPVLGRAGFHALAREARAPVAALGGMTAQAARSLGGVRWAAIDAWGVGAGPLGG